MKIKNLKVFGLALSGVLTMSTLSGCGSQPIYYEEKGIEFTRQFDVGEHIISVPLEDDFSEVPMQIETIPGYEIKGISMSAYGESFSYYAGGTLVYVNDEVVECKSNLYDADGNYVYLDFGTPLNYEEKATTTNGDIREFDVGEHILSIPIEYDILEENMQYEYHEGYEVVGIATSAYGKSFSYYAGGAILYKNTVPVRVSHQEEGYVTFGEPIEKEQVRGLN